MSPAIQVMITNESPRPGIDPVTSCSQGKHANHKAFNTLMKHIFNVKQGAIISAIYLSKHLNKSSANRLRSSIFYISNIPIYDCFISLETLFNCVFSCEMSEAAGYCNPTAQLMPTMPVLLLVHHVHLLQELR